MKTLATIFVVIFAGLAAAQQTGNSPPFHAATVVTGEYNRILKTLDLNGDGYADAVGWWPSKNTSGAINFQCWLNDTQGNLVPSWNSDIITTGSQSSIQSAAKGQLNADNYDDFVFSIQNDVFVFMSNGTGGATMFKKLSQSAGVYGVQIADFNNDSFNDIAVIMQGTIRIYFNGPHAFVTSSTISISPVGSPFDSVTLDANGDGRADLAVARYDSIDIVPIVNGVGQTQSHFGLPYTYEAMLAAGDIDNDGDTDIVSFFMIDYSVLRRTGAATFVLEPLVMGGPATDFADIDNDGDLDGVCCGGGGGGGYTPPVNSGVSIFRVSLNKGGVFTEAYEIPGLGAFHLAGAVDMEHDGDVDLVAGRDVFYSNGSIKSEIIPKSVGLGEIDARSICDFDGDGDPDVKFSIGGTYRNDGLGALSSVPVVMPAPPAGYVYEGPGFIGDFTNDGVPDLVVSLRQGTFSGPFVEMRMLTNSGGGALQDNGAAGSSGVDFNPNQNPAVYRNSPLAEFVADFNNDGFNELLVHSHYGPTMSSYEFVNNGHGKFFGGQYFSAQAAGIGDFNMDGFMDVVAGTQQTYLTSQATLGVYFNNGNNTFTLGPSFGPDAVDVNRGQIAVADFDGNGLPDISYIPYNYFLTILSNSGNGNFSAQKVLVAYPGIDAPLAVFGDDVDNNGSADLLYTASNSASVGFGISYASGPGWTPPLLQSGTLTATADFDGDGFIDILGSRTDSFDTSTRIILNRHYIKPSGGLRRQFGVSTVGTGGCAPTLGVAGPFTSGDTMELRLTGAVGGTGVLLVVGLAETSNINYPLIGLTSYADPWIDYALADASGSLGSPGAGTVVFPVMVTPQIAGNTYYLQGYAYDANVPGLIVQTNGLQLTIGQ
ncbi:MAG: VCBS repeat-containing protein [Planctomycetes bacterium]|nr:VCBS repeat-containing protein [Planctomycetota bacterium]